MIRTVKKRVLTLLMATAMIAGVCMSDTFAETTQAAVGIEPVTSSGISYTINETVIGFGGHEWWVIGDSSNGVKSGGDTQLTLWSKNHDFGFNEFNPMNMVNTYEGSTLQSTMNALPIGTGLEPGMIQTRATLDGIKGATPTNQKFWPLSLDEWRTVGNSTVRSYDLTFWLRSPYSAFTPEAYVGSPGGASTYNLEVDYIFAPRPAFYLNLPSVLFTSDAKGEGMKSEPVGSTSLETVQTPSSAIKMTVEDNTNLSLSTTTTNIAAYPGDTVSFQYNGARGGGSRSVSLIICDKTSGNILFYGRPVDLSGGDASGTAEFTIPADMEVGDYQLKVFNEEVNGENCTDYASTPENIALKINPKPIPVSTVNFPTASSITYGATLADAQLSGGTADSGSFAWEDGTTVPTVGNSGYTVVFTPNDVINYDYSGVSGWDSTTKTVRRVVAVPVSKATPDMALQASPSEGSLVGERVTLTAVLTGVSAGGSPTGSVVFKKGDTILGTVPLSNGKASYLWKDVPYGQHKLSVEYTGDTNYEEKKGNFLNYEVGKKNQSPLTITGVPKKLVYGDADFTLGAKGGNGSGALSYTLESGDGISIKGNKVSILKAGTAVIKVTKAADDTYNETSEVIRITIDKAEPVIQKSPSINGAKAGKTLQELSLEKLKAYGVDGKALTGSFAWKSAETVVSKGGKYTAVFTPNDKNYKSVNFEVQVNLDSTKPADSQKGNETSKKASSPNTADESSPFLYLTLLLTGLLGILGSKKLDIRR